MILRPHLDIAAMRAGPAKADVTTGHPLVQLLAELMKSQAT